MKSSPHTSPGRSSGDILGEKSYGLRGSVQSSAKEILGKASEIRRRYLGQLESSLLAVGTCEDHLKDIVSLLRLTDLCTEETHGENWKKTQEEYFYRAVIIGMRYLGEDLWNHALGGELFSAYLGHIVPDLSPVYMSDPRFIRAFSSDIEKESEKRRKLLLEKAADVKMYLNGITDYSDTIRALEETFGPVRLLIISEESGEPLTLHRIDQGNMEDIRRSSREIEYTLEVTIFDKPRKYRIIIDHGSAEPLNQIKSSHLKNIVAPILRRHIEQKEYAFTSFASDYRAITRDAEREMQIPSEPQRYDGLLKAVIRDIPTTSIPIEALEDPAYMRECMQAIDISRILTLRRTPENEDDRAGTIEAIDRILGGRITRRVLDMTRAILISGAEMMNGSGYPYGLSKKDIPLEVRLYTIIRAYEAICHREKDPRKVRDRLTEWNQGGYFDADIFAVFMRFLEEKEGGSLTHKVKESDIGTGVTPRRQAHYDDFLRNYDELGKLMREAEDTHQQFRTANGNNALRSRLTVQNNQLRALLVAKTQFLKIFFVTGHGQSPSDLVEGQPGDDDEGLTPLGITDSEAKRGIFHDLSVTIYSSPLPRTRETAEIIYGDRSARFGVISVEGLRNPPKHLSHRGKDDIASFIFDHPLGLLDFIRGIISSPHESANLLVAHRTINIYTIWILVNLNVEKIIVGERVRIKDEVIEVCLVRGDRRVEWDLLFPFLGWKEVMGEVDTICESIFGEKFSGNIGSHIHLIHLHKKFLDYMDRKIEESPELIERFLKQLDTGKRTKHFRSILGKSGLTF